MSSSDESPSRVGFRVHREWLQRLDQWRVNQPRTLTRTEAIRRLVELGLETESGKEVAKGKKKRSLSAAEADFYVHAKTISAFNGVLSILAVLVAKKLIDHNERLASMNRCRSHFQESATRGAPTWPLRSEGLMMFLRGLIAALSNHRSLSSRLSRTRK